MEPDLVLLDLANCGLTLRQVYQRVQELQAQYPDYDVFMDGDVYAIVGRRRV